MCAPHLAKGRYIIVQVEVQGDWANGAARCLSIIIALHLTSCLVVECGVIVRRMVSDLPQDIIDNFNVGL